MNYARKNKLTWWLVVISFVMSAVMFGAFIFGVVSNDTDSTTDVLSSNDYTLGTIDDSGKILESKKSAYTKDMYDVTDLEITVDEETVTVTYRVVYYDEDKEFISATEELEGDYEITSLPENAKYFRLVVTPYMVDGEDVTLTVFNKAKYVEQLEVTYKK